MQLKNPQSNKQTNKQTIERPHTAFTQTPHGNNMWSCGCGLLLVGSCLTKFEEINPGLKS